MARCASEDTSFGVGIKVPLPRKRRCKDNKKFACCNTFGNKPHTAKHVRSQKTLAAQNEKKVFKLHKRKYEISCKVEPSIKQQGYANTKTGSVKYRKYEIKPKTSHLYSCGGCGKSFSSFRKVKTHVLCHSKEKPFMCEICSAEFHSKIQMRQHAAESLNCINPSKKASSAMISKFKNHNGCFRTVNNEDAAEIETWIKQLKDNLKRKSGDEPQTDCHGALTKAGDAMPTMSINLCSSESRAKHNEKMSVKSYKNGNSTKVRENKEGADAAEVWNQQLETTISDEIAMEQSCETGGTVLASTQMQPQMLTYKYESLTNHLLLVTIPCNGSSQNCLSKEHNKGSQDTLALQNVYDSDINYATAEQSELIFLPMSVQVPKVPEIKPVAVSVLTVGGQLPTASKDNEFSVSELSIDCCATIDEHGNSHSTVDTCSPSCSKNKVHIVNLTCEKCKQHFGPDELNGHLLSHAAEEECVKPLISNSELVLQSTFPSTNSYNLCDIEDAKVKRAEGDLHFKPYKMETLRLHHRVKQQHNKCDAGQTAGAVCEDSEIEGTTDEINDVDEQLGITKHVAKYTILPGKADAGILEKHSAQDVTNPDKMLMDDSINLRNQSVTLKGVGGSSWWENKLADLNPNIQQTEEATSNANELPETEMLASSTKINGRQIVETQDRTHMTDVLESQLKAVKSTSKHTVDCSEQLCGVPVPWEEVPNLISGSRRASVTVEEAAECENDLIVLWEKPAVGRKSTECDDDVIIVTPKCEPIKFFCANCEKFCKSAKDLQKHEQLHTNQQPVEQIEDLADISVVWEKPVLKTKAINALQREDGPTKFFCVNCEDFFKTSTELQNHACAKHLGEPTDGSGKLICDKMVVSEKLIINHLEEQYSDETAVSEKQLGSLTSTHLIAEETENKLSAETAVSEKLTVGIKSVTNCAVESESENW